MPTLFYLAVVALVLLALAYAAMRAAVGLQAYRRFRGTRLVTCPETKKPAAVHVDARQAARSAALGHAVLKLDECSRWRERGPCGQPCLSQISAAPEDCLLRTIVARWYEGKSCSLCSRPIGPIDWLGHRPALVDRDLKTVAWDQVRPEELPALLATHQAVCWDCHIAETFRHEHAEMVTDRPEHAHLI